MRTIFAAALMTAAAAAMADEIDATPTPCRPVQHIHQTLANDYGEEPVVRGLQANGLVLELWASKGGRTWTHISIAPDGTGCVLAAGKAIEVRHRSDEGKPV